jgi:hypothetical protein
MGMMGLSLFILAFRFTTLQQIQIAFLALFVEILEQEAKSTLRNR